MAMPPTPDSAMSMTIEGAEKHPGLGQTPAYRPQLEYAFDIALEFHSRARFGPNHSGGFVGFVGIAGGVVRGPLLNGTIIPNSGGDWANMRSDGVVEFCAHYLIQTDDGVTIHVKNNGYGRAKPESLEVGEQFSSGELDEHYFRVTPRFDVPIGGHDWLNRTILLGAGIRYRDPDHTRFHYYAVR